MQKITIWRLWDKDMTKLKHNHIEDGHVSGLTPTPRSSEQSSNWPTEAERWVKEYGYRNNGEVLSEVEGLIAQFDQLINNIVSHGKHGVVGDHAVYAYKVSEEFLQKSAENLRAYYDHKWKREEA